MKKARPFYETSYKLKVAKMVVDQRLIISQVCNDFTIGSQPLPDRSSNIVLKSMVSQALASQSRKSNNAYGC